MNNSKKIMLRLPGQKLSKVLDFILKINEIDTWPKAIESIDMSSKQYDG